MDKNELSLVIQAEAQKALTTLKQLNEQFSKINSNLNFTKVNINQQFNIISDSFNRTGTSAKGLNNTLGNLGKSLFSLYSIRKITGYLYDAVGASINFTETLNLFNTALGENAKKGREFQNQLNETFGTNQEETLRSQGLYTAISTSLGLASDQAYLLGKNLTNLSLDLSSLYNKDIEKVNEALKSGLVGQTKAVRQLGMDITEKTLNAELVAMGITDKTTAVMSQTEKVILRYIVMLKQSTVAQGDFAKTIESPANQLRILKQQIAEITRWIGNIFYGAIKGVLPYIVGFSMALKEVIKTIAIFFGYKEETFGGALFADDLTDGLDTADASAKKLKNTLQSFDEIHNIETDTGDGALGGGIDQRLLDAMKDYQNAMENIRMKAVEIRDNILEWLGFSKDANGEWKFSEFKLGTIASILGGLLVTAGLIKAVGNIFKFGGGITKAIGKTATTATAGASSFSGLLGIAGLMAIIATACAIGYTFKISIDGLNEMYKVQQSQIDLNQQLNDGNQQYINDTLEKLRLGKLTEQEAKIFVDWANKGKSALEDQNTSLQTQSEKWWNKLTGQSGTMSLQMQENNRQVGLINGSLQSVDQYLKTGSISAGDMQTNIKGSREDYEKLVKNVGVIKFSTDRKEIDSALKAIGSINGATITTKMTVDTGGLRTALESVSKWFSSTGIGKAVGSFVDIVKNAFSFKADGGFVSTGEMFVAREAGPELVGKIGNKSGVANNDQIVSAVSQGVAQAVAGALGGKNGTNQFQLFIGGKEITDLVVKDINGMTQQFGSSPLK